MQAIIFANRSAAELAPLNRQYSAALMPLVNKALIEYTLEDLSCAGITHAKLVVANRASEIEAHIGTGAKWNLTIDYFLSKPEEDVNSVLQRMQLDPQQTQLVVRGDIIRTPCIKRFVDFASKIQHTFVLASMNNQNPGLLMLPAGRSHGASLNWPIAELPLNQQRSINQVLHGKTFHLDSIENFVAATSHIIKHAHEFAIKGRKVDSSETANLYLGQQTQCPSFTDKTVHGSIGENSFVHPLVSCKNLIVIGQNCFIEDSELNDSIIMPNTFVGKNLTVKNQIISQDYIIDITHSTWVKVDDTSLVAACQTGVKQQQKPSLVHRFIGFALLILALPLMLISLLVAKATSPQQPIIRFNASSNQQRTIQLYEIAVNSQILAKLPQLWHVAKGNLLLFGASATLNQQAKYGVFGPVQLLLDKNAPAEEIELVEMEFQQLSQLGYVKRLWQLA